MYALATLANKNALHDLNVFLFTLQLWNDSLPNLYIYCDSFVERYLLERKPYKGKLFIKNALDAYTNYNRVQMEELEGKEFITLFGDFVCEKMNLLNWVFTQNEKGILFCDADICFLGPLPIINTNKKMILSKHEIRSQDELRYGMYNAGFIYINDLTIPDRWKEHSKKSKFFEQISLEDLTREYSFELFSVQNNYGWWRLLQGKESETVLKTKWSIKRENNYSGIAVEGKALLSVHTHWKTNDNATQYFNTFVKGYLQKLSSVEKTNILYNYLKN